MDFNIEDGATDGYARQAILLYQGQKPGSYSSTGTTLMATLHQIANVGTRANPRVEIQPGSPITKEALFAVLKSLGDQHAMSADLLPENLLSYSSVHQMWWRPAGQTQVFFDCKELGKRGAMVPHPPLVFLVIGNQYHVFALKDSKRPGADTALFHAPYFNVYDSGSVCMGSAAKPSKITPEHIKEMEDSFFNSSFTHVNGKVKKIDHPRGEYAFWKDMLDGVYAEFPIDVLVPHGLTLAVLLDRMKRSGGQLG